MIKKLAVSWVFFFLSFTASANDTRAKAFSTDAGLSFVAIRGFLDINAANAYLKEYSLKAFEAQPGKTFAGFEFDSYSEKSVTWHTLKGLKGGGYNVGYAGIVVQDPRNASVPVYFINEISTNSKLLKTLYQLQSVAINGRAFSGFASPKALVDQHQVNLKWKGSKHTIARLVIGASSASELKPLNTFVPYDGNTVGLMYSNGLTKDKYLISNNEFRGDVVARVFDPSRDHFFVAKSTILAWIFSARYFTPYIVEMGNSLSGTGYMPQKVNVR
ncbi:MAG: hypothetical protein AB1540_03005 [Bdellovibrionota bacterium]